MEVTSRNGGGVDDTGDGTEGGVVVVCSDTISGLEVDEFGDVLITIKGVEEFVVAGVGKHEQWARGHGFGWVPHEEVNLRVVAQRIKFLDAEIVVIDKLMMLGHNTIHCFFIERSTAHAVKTIKRLNHRQI